MAFLKDKNGFCFESDLPGYLRKSLAAMKDCKAKWAEGLYVNNWDCFWDELNADINCAEADGDIDHEQANILRQEYLGMEVF